MTAKQFSQVTTSSSGISGHTLENVDHNKTHDPTGLSQVSTVNSIHGHELEQQPKRDPMLVASEHGHTAGPASVEPTPDQAYGVNEGAPATSNKTDATTGNIGAQEGQLGVSEADAEDSVPGAFPDPTPEIEKQEIELTGTNSRLESGIEGQ